MSFLLSLLLEFVGFVRSELFVGAVLVRVEETERVVDVSVRGGRRWTGLALEGRPAEPVFGPVVIRLQQKTQKHTFRFSVTASSTLLVKAEFWNHQISLTGDFMVTWHFESVRK